MCCVMYLIVYIVYLQTLSISEANRKKFKNAFNFQSRCMGALRLSASFVQYSTTFGKQEKLPTSFNKTLHNKTETSAENCGLKANYT